LTSKTESNIFSGYSHSRIVAYCGCLTSNQNVLICTKHIKKVIAKLYSHTLRSKITNKQYGQKFRLTTGPSKVGDVVTPLGPLGRLPVGADCSPKDLFRQSFPGHSGHMAELT